MKFSQRIGITPATKLAQRDSIDDELRASLWSALLTCHWDTAVDAQGRKLYESDLVRYSSLNQFLTLLWFLHFKYPTDTIPATWGKCLAGIRNYFFTAEWFAVYDFVEFILEHPPSRNDHFAGVCNAALERENSAYRIVNGKVTEITSEQEIAAVEDAVNSADPYPGVQRHLQAALALMSDRKSPDYRNSIKESISAVESLAKIIAGDPGATLGTALKELEKRKRLHPALKNAFSALYGYTSDADGIRHALLEESTLTKADAKFMLVCCSSFVNFVVESTGRS